MSVAMQVDWENRDTHGVSTIENLQPGDLVSVMGWRGNHKVTRRPWFHEQFQAYIAEVENENGRKVKVLAEELTLLSRTKRNTRATPRKWWYLTYDNTSLSDIGIRYLDTKVLLNKLSDFKPGVVVAKVTAISKAGKRVNFTVTQTKDGLAVRDLKFNNPKACGAVLCHVRKEVMAKLSK